MSYPYWGELVWTVVGGIAILLAPAILGVMFMAAHNYNKGRSAIVQAGMAHKAGSLSQRAGVNPLAFTWMLVVLFVGYYSFGYIVS